MAAAALGLVTLTAPAPAAMSAAPAPAAISAAPARTGSVFVEGDSLTVGSSSAIRLNLRSVFRRVTVDAQVGRNTPTGIARLRAARHARVWVVALGTNDAPNPGAMRRHVRTVLKRAGHRQVLWVSVWRSPAYRKVNRMLTSLESREARLTVLRWDRFIRKHPRLLAADGVHLTPAGYQVRGRLIADAVKAMLGGR